MLYKIFSIQPTVLTGCMGSRKGLGPSGTGGGETPLGMGDIGVGHLGLGQGTPYGIRLPNMFMAGLPSRGGGDGAYGDGGRKCRGDQPRPPGPPAGPPDMVCVRAPHLSLVRGCDTCHRIWNGKEATIITQGLLYKFVTYTGCSTRNCLL